MASIFSVFKTFRPRRTILSEDFNSLQAALSAAFDRIGSAPPAGETGVSSTFHCADPAEPQHAVTLGYFEDEGNAVFGANIEKARQWAELAPDTDVNGNTGDRSARHWATEAANSAALTETIRFEEAATPAQGARADEAHGWGDHTLAGYAVSANLNISNWDTAYGWGNHASAGYYKASSNATLGATTVNTLTIGSWTLTDVGGVLKFDNGTSRFAIDASGNVTADNDITAFGSP